MKRLFHGSSARYALALWLATILALFVVFIVQLEPAQWTAITVWIIFMQTPRLNYSKIIWWVFGTVMGAFMAILLIVFFNQTPDLFLLALALCLAFWAGAATLVKSYRAYGAVLAGYTCAIVSMSAVDHPEHVFNLAVTRVSCISIGMASAVLMMSILLPRHGHWKETLHHLNGYLKATLAQVITALTPVAGQSHFTWRHMVDRLSSLEHTLDVTTAESPESRLRADQARSLVATLFCLLAKAQSIEVHLSRPGTPALTSPLKALLADTRVVLSAFAEVASSEGAGIKADTVCIELERLRGEVTTLREMSCGASEVTEISHRFLLHRVDEILKEFIDAVRDWAGLFGPWRAPRPSCLATHRDYRTAFLYATRMFLAMSMVSALWFLTQWPSGSQLVLFMAVVCSLLSLLEHAPMLGWAFLKSAVFCFTIAFIDTFWLLQKAEGFVVLAFTLGLFLLPAAYAYRHPRLTGSAVVSMLIFYGLTMPSNLMVYDISAFLNNGLALLSATACGFFAFHAVPSMTPKTRRFWVLRAMRSDIAHAEMTGGELSEQLWTSRMFDRLRLIHLAAEKPVLAAESLKHENEALISLQLGLRQIRLRELLEEGEMSTEMKVKIRALFRTFRDIRLQPANVARFLRMTCTGFQNVIHNTPGKLPVAHLDAIPEIREMIALIESVTPLYID